MVYKFGNFGGIGKVVAGIRNRESGRRNWALSEVSCGPGFFKAYRKIMMEFNS
jgi:hypothetical protein